MRRVLLVVTAVLMLCGWSWAQGELSLKFGGKAWFTDCEYQWPGSEEVTGSGNLYGPVIGMTFPADFWFSAWILQGQVNYSGDARDYDIVDSEIVIGKGFFGVIDLGVGYRSEETISTSSSGSIRTTSSSGPLVYAGVGNTFGDSSLGWYGGCSWMFNDVDDEYDAGEHINVEGGLFLASEYFMLAGGYRWRNHYDQDNDLTYQGGTVRVIVTI